MKYFFILIVETKINLLSDFYKNNSYLRQHSRPIVDKYTHEEKFENQEIKVERLPHFKVLFVQIIFFLTICISV